MAVAPVAPPQLPRRRSSALGPAAALAGAALAAGVLFAIDPARHALYPTCWFRATTGLLCPGCGGLRATHQLLHGHWAAAWALNPVAVLLLPAYGWLLTHAVLRLTGQRGLPMPVPRSTVLWLGLAALLLFTVVRNLPGF